MKSIAGGIEKGGVLGLDLCFSSREKKDKRRIEMVVVKEIHLKIR